MLFDRVAFVFLFVGIVATGCGWAEADGPTASTPGDGPVATDSQPDDEAAQPDEPATTSTPEVTTPEPGEEPVAEPQENVEPGRYYHSNANPARCDGSFARCEVVPGAMPPAPAAALDYVSVADPVTNCDDADEYFGTGDGIACAFIRLRASIADPIAPEDFDHSFVYEVYPEGDSWRLEVFQVGPSGRVVPSSRLGANARSRWGFDDVTIDGDRIAARNGQVLVRTYYWGFSIDLVVRDATFEGTVSQQGDAVVLESGELSGDLHVLDLFAGLNQQASSCSDGPNEPFTEDSTRFARCPDFEDHLDPSCQAFDHYCPLFSPFALVADVDLNNDGLADAFSVRLDVEFAPGERRF